MKKSSLQSIKDFEDIGEKMYTLMEKLYPIARSITGEGVRKTLKILQTNFELKIVYSPAWTTDWMTGATKEKLRKYGIAPPADTVICPQCNSEKTTLISDFGATACKALYKCSDCLEPFEFFKCI